MFVKIDRDQSRFKQIVKGKIRENLRKYVTHGELIGRKGRDLVSIPIPQLDVPHFRYGQNGSGGVGQGDGEEGDPVGSGDPQDGDGRGQAGGDPGGHILEVEVSLEELAQIMGDELELPRIEPKGKANIIDEKTRYTSIRRTGPESLRHFKRTYMEALRRQISSNSYNASRPAGGADPRRQALPRLDDHAAARRQRRGHLPDGRVGVDDRRAEADRQDRGLLDRRVAQEPVRRAGNSLHHSRRRGQGGR